MNNERQITPTIREHAKKFHDLWTKGYSVAEAADMMGMNKFTIYKQLHLYAEVNGVASRLVYIRDYSARTINPKVVTLSTGHEEPYNDNEINGFVELSGESFTGLLSLCKEILEQAEISIGSADLILKSNASTSFNDIKEEII